MRPCERTIDSPAVKASSLLVRTPNMIHWKRISELMGGGFLTSDEQELKKWSSKAQKMVKAVTQRSLTDSIL